MKPPDMKILVADDHNLFRQGIIRLLQDNKGWVVIGEAENGLELVSKYFKLKPDIIIVDIAMPGISGIEAVEQIIEKDCKVKALYLSMYETDEYVYKVFRIGGMGLVNKNVLESELQYAISKVLKGEKYFGSKWDKNSLENLIKEYESVSNSTSDQEIILNYREIQILKLILEGNSSKDIARKLGLSKKTIDYYRSNICKKHGLKSASELTVFAYKYFLDNQETNSEND